MIGTEIVRLERQVETMRQENAADHKEIITKLNALCTKVAVTESKVTSFENWQSGHIEEHSGDERTRLGYLVTFIILAVSVAVEFAIVFFGGG